MVVVLGGGGERGRMPSWALACRGEPPYYYYPGRSFVRVCANLKAGGGGY